MKRAIAAVAAVVVVAGGPVDWQLTIQAPIAVGYSGLWIFFTEQ